MASATPSPAAITGPTTGIPAERHEAPVTKARCLKFFVNMIASLIIFFVLDKLIR